MRLCSVIAAFCFGLVAPAAALGAGGPVPPMQDGNGITTPGSPFRYVAVFRSTRMFTVRLTVPQRAWIQFMPGLALRWITAQPWKFRGS